LRASETVVLPVASREKYLKLN